jgi:putative ATPase
VPTHLQDTHRDAQALGHGRDYKYPHDFPGHYVEQNYLPEELSGARFYEPGTEGQELELADRWRTFKKIGKGSGDSNPES